MTGTFGGLREFLLNEVFVPVDRDPEEYVRELAGDMLGTDQLDLGLVTFAPHASGLIVADGRVLSAS